MALKKLLNLTEQATNERLVRACDTTGAAVCPKVRLADVLPIEGSGIPGHLYGYALKAHFDFVVRDSQWRPLFAVEFDGPAHDAPMQRHHDVQKNELCDRFELPLLRIDGRYLTQTYGPLDLLTWLVEVWFLKRAFEAAQDAGQIHWAEPFDLTGLRPAGEKGSRWELSEEVAQKIHKLADHGCCWDPGASWMVGMDAAGTYKALGYLRVTPSEGVIAVMGMQQRRFDVPIRVLLGEILTHNLYGRVLAVLGGREAPEAVEHIKTRIVDFKQRYKAVVARGFSRGENIYHEV